MWEKSFSDQIKIFFMNRRTWLATVPVGLGFVSGCLGGDSLSGSSNGVDAWRQIGFDATNRNHAPDATGPMDEVTVSWVQDTYLPTDTLLGDEDLYFHTSDGYPTSLDPDGELRWQQDSVTGRVVAVTEENVFIANEESGRLLALNPDDGETHETLDLPLARTYGTSLFTDGIYTPTGEGIARIDIEEVTVDWEGNLAEHPDVVTADAGLALSAPAVTGDHAITADYRSTPGGPFVYGLDNDGDLDWIASLDLPGWTVMGYPVLGNDHVFVAVNRPDTRAADAGDDDAGDDSDARIIALEPESGAVEWEVEIAGNINGAPAYADGTVYVEHGKGDGGGVTVEAISVADQSPKWQVESDTLFQVTTPVIIGDTVYSAVGEYLLGVDSDGDLLWRFSMEDWAVDEGYSLEEYHEFWPWPMGPIALGDTFYCWGADGWLFALQ